MRQNTIRIDTQYHHLQPGNAMTKHRYSIHPLPYAHFAVKANLVIDPAGLIVEPHHHLYHELDYVIAGQGSFSIGHEDFSVKPGDVVYLGRGIYHRRCSDVHSPLVLCNLIFSDPLFYRTLCPSKQESEQPAYWPWWQHWSAKSLADREMQIFFRFITLLAERASNPTPAQLERIINGTRQLFHTELQPHTQVNCGILALAESVRRNPERHITLAEEASRIGVSRTWLSRAFHQYFGVTLFEYRDFARVDQAATLLLSGNKEIQEISRQIGYQSTTQFINTFSRIAGMTPRRFRKRFVTPPTEIMIGATG